MLKFDDFILESKSVPDEEVWKKWKVLINMTVKELKDFYDSEEGKDAGLRPSEAKITGIDYGRESARMIIKMLPHSDTYEEAERHWTTSMWKWARKQNSFNSRMIGAKKRIKGDPYEKNGKMTRWLKSLLIWGHDPRKNHKD